MRTEFLSLSELNKPQGFSHVTIAGPGRLVFVAGQVARDAAGKIVGPNDLAVQTDQVYQNLKIALAAAGVTMKDVVKVVTYVVGLTAEKAALVRTVRSRHLNSEPYPASTLVGVESLVTPDLLIEIEVIAAID